MNKELDRLTKSDFFHSSKKPSPLILLPNSLTSLPDGSNSDIETDSTPASPALSKFRKTSQFFSQWTPAFVKASAKFLESPYPLGRSRSENETSSILSILEKGPILRRESVSSTKEPITPINVHTQFSPIESSIDPGKASPTGSMVSALRSFHQLQPENEPVDDFEQLRSAFQNFQIKHQNDTQASDVDLENKNNSDEKQLPEEVLSTSPREVSFAPVQKPVSKTFDSENYDNLLKERFLTASLIPEVRAALLFENEPQIMPMTEIAAYLGQRGEEFSIVLEAYMKHFNFSKLRLDEAFRKLCSHLYLQGETQVIDRILAAFARRYWSNNTDTVFKTQDVVYAVAYSLLLLNTDLHVARNHSKMTRGSFIRNTLSVITSNDAFTSENPDSVETSLYQSHEELISVLKELYSAIKHHPILQLRESPEETDQSGSNKPDLARVRSSSRLYSLKNIGRSSTPYEKRPSSLNLGSQQPLTEPPDLISDLYCEPPSPKHQSIANPTVAAVYPYTKMGLLIRKHLYERTDKKAAQRTWRECLVVIGQGAIRMFKVDRNTKLPGAYGDPPVPIDPNLPQGEVLLRHSLAVALPPPGYSSSRPHVFALQLPSGGTYLFQAAAADQVSAWVVICNFWAARESKAPLPGGVSNIDYGWGSSLNNEADTESNEAIELINSDPSQPISSQQLFDTLPTPSHTPTILEWHPPSLPMVRSQLSEEEQLTSLQNQITSLNAELVTQMERRDIIQRRLPPRSAPYTLAFSNWEKQSQYFLRELIKYQTYEDILKRTLFSQDVPTISPDCKTIQNSETNDTQTPDPLSTNLFNSEE